MMKRIAPLLIGLAWPGLTCATLIYDSTPGNSQTDRPAANSPALHIWNTNPFNLSVRRAEFYGDLKSPTETLKFFIADSSGSILSSTVVDMTDAGLGFYGVDVDWTLSAGSTYYICATTLSSGAIFRYDTEFDTQNGIQSLANGNFEGFAEPILTGIAGARMSWRLSDAVPEPATATALVAGLAALIVRRRRR